MAARSPRGLSLRWAMSLVLMACLPAWLMARQHRAESLRSRAAWHAAAEVQWRDLLDLGLDASQGRLFDEGGEFIGEGRPSQMAEYHKSQRLQLQARAARWWWPW